jgi:hypothetical protein
MDELRAVTAFAVACAGDCLDIFEHACPADPRPRAAVETGRDFAQGGRRTKAIRDAAWASMKAAHETGDPAASQAARASIAACSAAYLHPLARATQVKHILGAAAHAARAVELAAGDDRAVGDAHIAQAAKRATLVVIEVLSRYPTAPAGGGRVDELVRALDARLRGAGD